VREPERQGQAQDQQSGGQGRADERRRRSGMSGSIINSAIAAARIHGSVFPTLAPFGSESRSSTSL